MRIKQLQDIIKELERDAETLSDMIRRSPTELATQRAYIAVKLSLAEKYKELAQKYKTALDKAA